MHSSTFYVHRITSHWIDVVDEWRSEAAFVATLLLYYYFISRNWFNADCNLISNIWIFCRFATSNSWLWWSAFHVVAGVFFYCWCCCLLKMLVVLKTMFPFGKIEIILFITHHFHHSNMLCASYVFINAHVWCDMILSSLE